MSTTTNFKRIALVAVAALGLGVLSSVPSNAAINADTLTLSAASAGQTTGETYTATSAVATVSFFGAVGDSVSVTAALTAAPTGNTALPTLQLVETSSAIVESNTTTGAKLDIGDTKTANTAVTTKAGSASVTTTAKFAVYLTQGNGRTAPTTVGTYTVKLTPAAIGVGALQGSAAVTLTINVTAAATLDTTASAATTTSYLQLGTTDPSGKQISSDSVVAVSRTNTSGAVQAGYIEVTQLNAASGSSTESLTAEISGPGTLGSGVYNAASRGRSLTVKKADYITIWNDGSSGVSTITIKGSVSGVTLATEKVTFYGAMSTLAGTVNTTILAVGANAGAVSVGSKDSAAVTMASLQSLETIYAFSSDTTIATVPATALSYSVDSATVAVTGVKAGTATITFGNAATLATSTIKSTAVSVRVGSTSVASVTVAFDKASYVPGEKATITVSAKDSLGNLVVPATYELWASAYGLNFAKGFSSGTAPATTETSVATSALTGLKTYTVYMPVTSGAVTLTGTLAKTGDVDYAPIGTLKTAAAIQGTVVTATATVTDSGAAALAAVTALATTVASLKTLITTLTNLVLKIQKKVKA